MIFDADMKTGVPIKPYFNGTLQFDENGVAFKGTSGSQNNFRLSWGRFGVQASGTKILISQGDVYHQFMAHHTPVHVVGQIVSFVETNNRFPNDDEYQRMKAVSTSMKSSGCLVFVAVPMLGLFAWEASKFI